MLKLERYQPQKIQSSHLKPPFHKNLFNLKFSIGSYFKKNEGREENTAGKKSLGSVSKIQNVTQHFMDTAA